MDKGFDDLNSFLKNSYEKNKLKIKKKNKYVVILINIITIVTLIGAGIGIKSINDYKEEIKKAKEYEENIRRYQDKYIRTFLSILRGRKIYDLPDEKPVKKSISFRR